MFNATPDFIGKAAPPNYVAGLGRGATGFTTRSDIGPARESAFPDIRRIPGTGFPDPSNPAAASSTGSGSLPHQHQQGQRDLSASTTAIAPKDDSDNEDPYQDPDNETGLFASIPYDDDDEEADRIYADVDAAMDSRRKARREARVREELLRYRATRPKIQQQFSDLKTQLSSVSADDWAALPEPGDLVGKRGKKKEKNARAERYYTPVPDSLLERARQETEFVGKLDEKQQRFGGMATPLAADASGTRTNFHEIGAARDKVLSLKLDQVSDSVSGQTNIDPKGYLTSLSALNLKSDAEIGDTKKARLLLKSVIATNPKNAPGWIAAARLEEIAGDLVEARHLIAKGCEQVPRNEDVWIEAARLNKPKQAKLILATAVRHVPTSVKVWQAAMHLETETPAQKRVLKKALEFIPSSANLWKALVNLEDNEEDAKILLSRAVECCPLSTELWLAFAKLETFDNARKILNRARHAIPTSHDVWIAAARLVEENNDIKAVETIISRAVTVLSVNGNVLNREQWLKEAEDCEKYGNVETCRAIVRNTISLDVEEEDRMVTWMDDADTAIQHKSLETARAIYQFALKTFPSRKSLWRAAVFLEKEHGTAESLEEMLSKAVKYFPQAPFLWLMWAKEKWIQGDVDAARSVLANANDANPDSSEVWLAAVKLEQENEEYDRARLLLERARQKAHSEPRVWMKSAVLERHLHETKAERSILAEATSRHPGYDKLWMMYGQVEHRLGNIAAARERYQVGSKHCPKSIPLWILASRLEETEGQLIKSRAVLDKAKLHNPKNPVLLVEAVRVEMRAGNAQIGKHLMAKALQECPNSGILWAEAIFMEARPQRKAVSIDALKKCDNDPLVICAVARLFWGERKIDKTRNWFNRAVKLDPDNGDLWCYLFKFEKQYATSPEELNELLERIKDADPRHGEVWTTVNKDPHRSRKSLKVRVEAASELLANQR